MEMVMTSRAKSQKKSSIQAPTTTVKYRLDAETVTKDTADGFATAGLQPTLVDSLQNLDDVRMNRYVKTVQCCTKPCCCIPTPCCSRTAKDRFRSFDLALKLLLAVFHATNGFDSRSNYILLVIFRMLLVGILFLDTLIKLLACVVEHILCHFELTTLPPSDKQLSIPLKVTRPAVLIACVSLLLTPIFRASEMEIRLVEETKRMWGENALAPHPVSEKVNLFLWSCFGQLVMITMQQFGRPDLTLVYKTIDPSVETPNLPKMNIDKSSFRYVEYDPELKLDVYLPYSESLRNKKGGFPVVVFFHGGGWVYRTRKDYPIAVVEFLRMRGVGFISVEYRLLQHGWNGSDILSDAHDVFEYLYTHGASKIGVDMNRSVVMGNSAGGHLAMMVGYSLLKSKSEKNGKNYGVNGIINWCGVVPNKNDVEGAALDESSVHYRFTMNKDWMKKLYNPINHINKDSPPTLIIHGTADLLVSINRSRLVMKALQNNSVPAQLVDVPGEIHACENEPFGSCHQYGVFAIQYFLYNIFY